MKLRTKIFALWALLWIVATAHAALLTNLVKTSVVGDTLPIAMGKINTNLTGLSTQVDLAITDGNGFGRSGTNFATVQFISTNAWLLIDPGSGLPPVNIAVSNLFRGSNAVFWTGNYFEMRSLHPTQPASIAFSDTVHGTHGVVLVGNLQSDVVISPTISDGGFQIGMTGGAGSYHYLQYASTAVSTAQSGFSHPLEWVARYTNTAAGGGYRTVRPGIVGFPMSTAVGALGQLRFYASTPHWNAFNHDGTAPDTVGVEAFRADTNGITLPFGGKFYGDGSSLSNLAAGGTGLSLDVLMPGNMVATFTSGSLSAYQAIDSTAQTFFTRAGVTNTTEIAAINRFIRTMKASTTTFNITNWDAFYPHPLAAGFGYNALSTSYDITWTGSPSQGGQQGVNFDGTDDYGDTGINFRSGTTIGKTNRYTLVAYLSAATLDDLDVLIGAQNSSAVLLRRNGSFAQHLTESLWAQTIPPTDLSGLWIATRESVSSKSIDVKGSTANDTTTMTDFPNSNFWIGARDNGGPSNRLNGRLRLELIGGVLDAAGIAELKTAVAQFWTDLGITP